jgi:hypothetical protein
VPSPVRLILIVVAESVASAASPREPQGGALAR